MNEPDAGKPDAVNVPPEALASGQRTLAAIVFTDTVSFSALMSKNEDLTLRLVARDLDLMKATCLAFGGQVLKSTGDGLLMLFTSAVQAVACALEIQRDVQKRSLDLPKDEQLRHRIGIHLGDVFQHGNDVMGDGVNIAARLQTEAVPGGICVSKTVYDVVHNRLPFYVNDLGARKLKNIGKVTAYQISPMEEGATGLRFARWYRWRPWIVWGGGLVALIVVLVLALNLGMYLQHRQWQSHHGVPKNEAATAGSPGPSIASPLTTTLNTSSAAIPDSTQEASDTEYQDACFQYMTKYDFDGMRSWIQAHDWPGKSTDTLAATCPQLNHLITWAHEQLQKYSFDRPLKVVGKGKTFSYWPAPFGGVKLKIEPNHPPLESSPTPAPPILKTLGADQIQPLGMLGIIRELMKENTTPNDPLTPQLEQELQLFIETYHIVAISNRTAPTPTPLVGTPESPASPPSPSSP